jgi:hypothetical protein
MGVCRVTAHDPRHDGTALENADLQNVATPN